MAGARAAVNSAGIRAGKSPRGSAFWRYRHVTGDSLASYCRFYRMAGSKRMRASPEHLQNMFRTFSELFQNRGGGPTRGFMFRAEIWLRGMLAAVISGGANGVITGFAAIGIDPTHFNLAAGFVHTLSLAGVSAVMSGIIGVAAYLKQSPLPGDGAPGEYDQHDRYDAASRRHGERHEDNAHEGNAHEGNADERREIPEAQSGDEHPGERRGEHSSVEHAASEHVVSELVLSERGATEREPGEHAGAKPALFERSEHFAERPGVPPGNLLGARAAARSFTSHAGPQDQRQPQGRT